MKKFFFKSITMHALLVIILSLLASCRKDHRTQLSAEQLTFLATPGTGKTLEFDENGTRTTLTVGGFAQYISHEDRTQSGFHGIETYSREITTVHYTSPPSTESKIYLTASSEDYSNHPSQKINVKGESDESLYTIDFNKRLSSRTINGISYSNVVIGLNEYRSDTLFWKEGIGILGWKRADQNFTAYRVF